MNDLSHGVIKKTTEQNRISPQDGALRQRSKMMVVAPIKVRISQSQSSS